MNWVLGFDTSCYTTSVAILDLEGGLLADSRRMLTVRQGGRGLAQSEMVFQHTRNMPAVLEEALAKVAGAPAAIGVTDCPRPLPDSYMPAFLVGAGFAKALALSHRVPLLTLSHQENHILAGVWSAGGPYAERFLAVHVSGGTSEILLAQRLQGQRLALKLLGGTIDLHAGQFVDRVGVALGLPFPAGRHLEALARTATGSVRLPVAVTRLDASFSGPASQALRLISAGGEPAEIAYAVETCIAETVARLIHAAVAETGTTDVLLAGGVMANQHIRVYLEERLAAVCRLFWPQAAYSPDNAVGAAFYSLLVR
ncbi:MAG: O-sialoglycoprotein endopeptidase [Sporomusaceae bacterium]|nr:O-sialoglycoprotein endopeptidase [Sporomusaceae bacterium]